MDPQITALDGMSLDFGHRLAAYMWPSPSYSRRGSRLLGPSACRQCLNIIRHTAETIVILILTDQYDDVSVPGLLPDGRGQLHHHIMPRS